MITILGEYIEIVRPSLIRLPQKTKIKSHRFNHSVKTTVQAKVIAVCIDTELGIYQIPSGSHIDVLTAFHILPENVKRTGWKLDNGEYLWR